MRAKNEKKKNILRDIESSLILSNIALIENKPHFASTWFKSSDIAIRIKVKM